MSAAAKQLLRVFAAAAGMGLVCASVANPWLHAVALAALLIPILLAWSRLQLQGLVISFLVAESVVHILKRGVFLAGAQPRGAYYALQALPAVLLALALSAAIPALRRRPLPWSGRLLCGYLVVAASSLLANLSRLPWTVSAAAAYEYLFPLAAFYAGLALRPVSLPRVARWLALLAAVSVAYGLLQLATGPTLLDRVWATETQSYSIHGGKVFAFLEGVTPEFRAFSYYADPLTWGLFLVAGFAAGAIARETGSLSRRGWLLLSWWLLAGLFCTLTRTAWVGLLATVAVFGALGWRGARRPWLIFSMTLLSFAAAMTAGNYLYRNLFLGKRRPAVSSVIASRYLNLGTIEARISAWDALRQEVRSTPLVGRSHGEMEQALRGSRTDADSRPRLHHNFLVELVSSTGLPGAALFLLFYFQWLREAVVRLRSAADPRWRRALRWLMAFAVGGMVTGYLNGLSFMTCEMFLMMGVTVGDGWRALPRPALQWAGRAPRRAPAFPASPDWRVRGQAAV